MTAHSVCVISANAGDKRETGLIPVSGRFPGEGNGSLLQYSCLENPMDRGAWWATVHRTQSNMTDFHFIHKRLI